MTEQKYGIWGGRRPAGMWCQVWDPSKPTNTASYSGTREEAEDSAEALRKSHPGNQYTVIFFDPDKEPVASLKPISPVQRKALEAVAGGMNGNTLWREFRKSTISSLLDRGLIMYGVKDPKKLMEITRAGLEAIGK